MTKPTETELKELKDLINNRFDKVEERLQALEIGLTEARTKLTSIEPLVQKIPDLSEKVGELKNWRQIAIIVIAATVSGVFGWFIKGR